MRLRSLPAQNLPPKARPWKQTAVPLSGTSHATGHLSARSADFRLDRARLKFEDQLISLMATGLNGMVAGIIIPQVTEIVHFLYNYFLKSFIDQK